VEEVVIFICLEIFSSRQDTQLICWQIPLVQMLPDSPNSVKKLMS